MKHMIPPKFLAGLFFAGVFVLTGAPALAAACCDSFAGTRWALTLPNGASGWLGVTANGAALEGSLLWGGGNPVPVAVAKSDKGLLVTRKRVDRQKREFTDVITAERSGADVLILTVQTLDGAGAKLTGPAPFTGKLIPPLPPKPDLSKLVFGKPVNLIGETLDGWAVMNPKAYNGWSLKNGVLSNKVVGADGKVQHGTNLRTVAANFGDFNLKFEVNVPAKSNSGVYLRGIYEIQVFDSHGLPLSNLNMGALYGRITPKVAAEKPPGEWQTVDVTLVDRHVTVILNGTTIIDNEPALGCTGGALTPDEFLPGPIYLQGDHSNADYRKMTLTPIVKK
jgi:hypothetical protein